MAYGLDFSWARPSAQTIKNAGYTFVQRYLAPTPNGKVISKSEYLYYLTNGLDVGLNWENYANDALRGASGGKWDATMACEQAKALGYPKGATIQFSYDVNYSTSQYPILRAYGSAVNTICHAYGYRSGGYGGFYVVEHLGANHIHDDYWQTYAWSSGKWSRYANLRQIQNGIYVGGDVDKNVTVGPTYTAKHPYKPPTVPTPEDDEMTKDEHAAVMTASAFAYAQAAGADTYWLYSPDGTRKSVSMKAYWDKIATTVVAKSKA